MPEDNARAHPLDVWKAAGRLKSIGSSVLFLGVPFSLICVYAAGRLVFGFNNALGWSLLALAPVLLCALAAVEHRRGAILLEMLDRQIGSAGVTALGLRDEAGALKTEVLRLLNLKKSFLQSLQLHAAGPDETSSDAQVRIRSLSKAVEDVEPTIEKLSSQMGRLDGLLERDAVDLKKDAIRWDDFLSTYEQAVVELTGARDRLLS